MKRERETPGAWLRARPVRDLGSLVEALAEVHGDLPALQIPRPGALYRVSFRDLARQVGSLAAHLRHLGVQPRDRIVLCGDNSPEWILAAFAVFAVGAIAVPLDPQPTEQEACTLLAHCSPRGVFGSPRLLPMLQHVLEPQAAEAALPFVIALSPEAFDRLEPREAPERRIGSDPLAGDAVAAILYTSGTTGTPKGVMLTHRNFLFDAERCLELLYAKQADCSFALLPLHHAYSFTCLLVGLISGTPATLPPSLKPDRIVAAMRETRVTVLPAVPLVVDHLAMGVQERIAALPPLRAWLAHRLIRLSAALRPIAGAGLSRRLCAPILEQLGGLRLLVVGGAPLNPDSARFFHALGVTVLNGYGLTETAPVLTLTPTPWQDGDGVGKPLRGVEVRLEATNAMGVGEIHVRADCVMAGYYRNPEATAEVLRDGWLNTQDLGRFDARGNLHLLGRSRNVIVLSSGKNVYPEDLEAHYGQSPLLQEICVIRGREADGSEFPFGVLVPDSRMLASCHPGVESPEAITALLAKELSRLSAGLADYKRLKRFTISQEPLPRTTSRKIRRHQVQEAFSSALAV